MKLELNIHVTYKTNGVLACDLVELLEQAAEHLLDNGLLTGETDAEVSDCTHEVKRLD
jgi:hypothetical protein